MVNVCVCHFQNHFTGLHAREGYFQHFDNGKVQVWNIGQVACLANCSEVTLFKVKPMSQRGNEAPGLEGIVGGSNGKYTYPLSTCVLDGCCETLLPKQVVDATLYGLGGPQEVQVETKVFVQDV